jgi:hypothetical protein
MGISTMSSSSQEMPKATLERQGMVFSDAPEADEAGPVNAAAVVLADGRQYLLIEHCAHPDQFIDVRGSLVGHRRPSWQSFIDAAAIPRTQINWVRDV